MITFPIENKEPELGNSYRSWFEIIFGVTQSSMWEPILFNMFYAGLFFVLKNVNIANFANENTSLILSQKILTS